MDYIEVEPGKPKNIALSFSGGGFRAAAYTLGCLSYLDRVRLGEKPFLEHVRFLSSASGGTITSLTYSLSQHRGQSFAEFYRDLKGKLEGRRLLDRVFQFLQTDDAWTSRPFKGRNLINGFALAYDEILFDGATFGELFPQRDGAIAEICANATEFNNGMQFRFQNVGVRGNTFLHFKTDALLRQLKLGDILAASSCFTVGFEPIVYPADFHYAALDKKAMEDDIAQDSRFSPEKKDTETKVPCFDLMDGGIDDNQGIGSFLLAEGRQQTADGQGYGLYLACDVSSDFTSGFTFPEENKKSPFLRPSLAVYFWAVLFFFLLAAAGLILKVLPRLSAAVLGASALALSVCLLVLLKLRAAHATAQRTGNTFGLTIIPSLGMFARLRLSALLQMVSSRASSTGYLAAVVFLKKIRRISYDRLFEKIIETKTDSGIRAKHLRRFALQNALSLLSAKNNQQRLETLRKEPYFTDTVGKTMEPSPALQTIVDLATAMDTTLWFDKVQDEKRMLPSLLAAGAATSCYNLLLWAQRFDQTDPYWKTLVDTLTADWHNFNRDPFWLHDQFEGSKDTVTSPKI